MNNVNITLVVGSTISARIASAAQARHPDSGLVVIIEGNPNGFMPNSLLAGKTRHDKEERRAFLLANAGDDSLNSIEVLVKEARMTTPPATEKNPSPAERPRIIVDEESLMLRRNLEALTEQVNTLRPGMVLDGCVLSTCMKNNDDGEGQHAIGYFVELLIGLTAFLHKSEAEGLLQDGDMVQVAVRTAEVQNDRPRISVSQKDVRAKMALAHEVKAGSKTTGRNLRLGTVAGVDGFTMEIGSSARPIKAFLPLTQIEGDPQSLLKGNRCAKVTVLPLTTGEYVRVTRRTLVAEVVASMNSAAAGVR